MICEQQKWATFASDKYHNLGSSMTHAVLVSVKEVLGHLLT